MIHMQYLKYGFKEKPVEYFGIYVKYVVVGIVTFFITKIISESLSRTLFITFIWKLTCCIIIPNILFIIIFYKKEEMKYLKEKIKNLLAK